MNKRFINQKIENHEFLSEKNKLFIEYVNKNPEFLNKNNFTYLNEGQLFPDSILNPWPTFISKETESYFEQTSISIFNLIKSIPKRIFDNNAQKISEYYKIPLYQVEVLLWSIPTNHIDNLLGRGDFIIDHKNELQCIEYNIATGLGGWEQELFVDVYMKSKHIEKFIVDNDLELKKSQFFKYLILHIQNAVEVNKINSEQNFLRICIVDPRFVNSDCYEDERIVAIKNSVESTFKNNNIEGEVIFCNYDQLEGTSNGVFYNKKQIHCLLEWVGSTPASFLRIAQKNKVIILNGAITYLMTNKFNISLLSEYQDSKLFTEEERELIKKHIPWTRKLIDKNTHYKDENCSLKSMVLKKQTNFVLKRSLGSSGDDVFIGSKVSSEIWREKVELALKEESWIVQEYVKPQDYWYQINQNEAALHEIVFGFFVFGTTYAGGYVRLLPSDNEYGIINAKLGANVSPIFVIE
ncbi:MAG: hypothetical protein GQ564_17860 [Bacteroidales bacterium]|nr:hypothetical protein [Bacteroidales bacterium]